MTNNIDRTIAIAKKLFCEETPIEVLDTLSDQLMQDGYYPVTRSALKFKADHEFVEEKTIHIIDDWFIAECGIPDLILVDDTDEIVLDDEIALILLSQEDVIIDDFFFDEDIDDLFLVDEID